MQFFLLANPDDEHALTEPSLIRYALIKLTKTGGMYAKGIEKWKKRPTQDRQKWGKLSSHMVDSYESQLIETVGTTMGQEGYITSMNTIEYLMDVDFLTEAFTTYAERVTQSEAHMA